MKKKVVKKKVVRKKDEENSKKTASDDEKTRLIGLARRVLPRPPESLALAKAFATANPKVTKAAATATARVPGGAHPDALIKREADGLFTSPLVPGRFDSVIELVVALGR